MNINEFIKKICEDNKVSQTRLGAGIGLTRGGIYNLTRAKGMSLKTLSRICNFFDYEIVIRPKSSIDRQARTIVLEVEEES